MTKTKQTPNDQGELIELIKQNKFYKVWDIVKFVGYKDIPDVSERMRICRKAMHKFDPEMNNNFIMFYKRYLHFDKTSLGDSKYHSLTQNQTVLNGLKTGLISPSSDVSHILRDVQKILPSSKDM